MSDLQFGRARALLYDPQYMNRQVTLGALQTIGVMQIEPVARLGDLSAALTSTPFELMVAELQGSESAVCDIVRRVRQRTLGQDPFLVILLTTWDLNAECVRAVLNSGADDLLARPYTIAQLQQRVVGAVLSRKPFVVTADYVGPSRRNSARAVGEGELFEVPNLLRERVMPGEEPSTPDLETGWRVVMRWKVTRLSRQLEAWAASLRDCEISRNDSEATTNLLKSMAIAAHELQVHSLKVENPAFAAVAGHCAELKDVASGQPDGGTLTRIGEVAALIADQVRIASMTPPAEKGAPGTGSPFYVA